MSGGSFDYLCYKDAPETLRSEELSRMAAAIRSYQGGEPAAAATTALVGYLRAFERRIEALRDVWKAVEWHHSGDWGQEAVGRALAEYERHFESSSGESRKILTQEDLLDYLNTHDQVFVFRCADCSSLVAETSDSVRAMPIVARGVVVVARCQPCSDARRNDPVSRNPAATWWP